MKITNKYNLKKLIFIAIIVLLFNSCKEKAADPVFITPNATTTWKMGEIQQIKWRADAKNIDTSSLVSIYLYKEGENDENYYEIIQENWHNNGEYQWYIDPVITSKIHCYLKIAANYKTEGVISELFTITTASLPFSFVAPSQTDILNNDSIYMIRWSCPQELQYKQVKIDLYRIENQRPVLFKNIIENTQNDNECPWLIDIEETGEYRLKISTLEQDASGISNVFMIEKKLAPDFSEPNAQSVWTEGELETIVWQIKNWGLVDIYLYRQGNTGGNYELKIADDATDNGNFTNWTVNANLQNNENGVFYIKIIPYNENTQSNGIKSENFTINGI